MQNRTYLAVALMAACAIFVMWWAWPDSPDSTDGPRHVGHPSAPPARDVTSSARTSPLETDRYREAPAADAKRPEPESARLQIKVLDDQGRAKPNVQVIVFTDTEVLAMRETHAPGLVTLEAIPLVPRVLMYDGDLMECETLASGSGTHEVVLASPHQLKGRVLIDGRAADRTMVIKKTAYARRAAARILPSVGEHVLKVLPEKAVIMAVSHDPSVFNFGQISPYWQGALEFPRGFLLDGATNPKDWRKGPELELDCPRDYLIIDLTRMPVVSGRILMPESRRNLTWMRVRCVANVRKPGKSSMHMWGAGVDVETRRFQATLGDTGVTHLSFEVYDSSKRLVGTSAQIAGPFVADRDLGDVIIRE